MLGLPSKIVCACPYNPEWPRVFREEQARLRACIGGYVLDIQHVGSTSIPGMAAKPILDIGIAVADFEEAAQCIQPLQQLGYLYRGENSIPRRHYFVKGDPITHHLHMVELGSDQWATAICFRDHLREHAEIARAYATLKQRLAEQFPTDRSAYQDGKAAFIAEVLRAAREKERLPGP
jgi:GrpB-like predicted nucleotidyltransferase (UPF0157 family)